VVIEGGRRKLVYGKAGKAMITILKGSRKHMGTDMIGGPMAQAGQLVAHGPRVLAKTQVVVKKAHPILGVLNVPSGMKVGDTFDLIVPKSPSKGMWMWGSTNPEVLDIVDGKATIKGSGEAYVVAMQMATRNYRNASVATRFLAEEYPTINWSLNEFVYYDAHQPFVMDAPTSNSKGAFTYSTDSTKVFISVDNSDKTKLNITWDTSPGSKTPYYTVLYANQAADGEYYNDYAECNLNIADSNGQLLIGNLLGSRRAVDVKCTDIVLEK
jgi:hypothetical protein